MADLFNPTDRFTAADKLACAERELRFRRRVYADRVAMRKMTQEKADHEVGCMEAIVADYRAKLGEEDGVGRPVR